MIGVLMTNKESAEESESFPTRRTGPVEFLDKEKVDLFLDYSPREVVTPSFKDGIRFPFVISTKKSKLFVKNRFPDEKKF